MIHNSVEWPGESAHGHWGVSRQANRDRVLITIQGYDDPMNGTRIAVEPSRALDIASDLARVGQSALARRCAHGPICMDTDGILIRIDAGDASRVVVDIEDLESGMGTGVLVMSGEHALLFAAEIARRSAEVIERILGDATSFRPGGLPVDRTASDN